MKTLEGTHAVAVHELILESLKGSDLEGKVTGIQFSITEHADEEFTADVVDLLDAENEEIYEDDCEHYWSVFDKINDGLLEAISPLIKAEGENLESGWAISLTEAEAACKIWDTYS